MNDQIIFFKEKVLNLLRLPKSTLLIKTWLFRFKIIRSGIPNTTNQSLESRNRGSSNMDTNTSSFTIANVGIEQVRVYAVNKIKQIESQIEKQMNDNDSDTIKYMGSTMPDIYETKIFGQLENIDAKLSEYRTRYKPNDSIILRLEETKEFINLLKNESISYLNAEKITAEALKESATPKRCIVKIQGANPGSS